MSRKHALVVAAMFGLAAVIGFTALSRTVQLGSASRHANDAIVVAKTRQLNVFERSLHRQLAASHMPSAAATAAKRGLAPAAAPTATGGLPPAVAPAAAPKPQAQRVVYVRPPPIIVHKHRAGGESEAEHESEGSDD